MATIQVINIGASANDNTGDPLRTAFDKTNQNNTALNNDLAIKAPLANPSFTGAVVSANDIVVNGITIGKGGGNILTNTISGRMCLQSNTTGDRNVANGSQALQNNTLGSFNTSNGDSSLFNNTIGNNNTADGFAALSNNINFNNVSGFGANTQVSASNQVQLGDSATTTYVYGTVQNRSDLRDKADIQDTVLGLDFISKLRPVDYRWDMRENYKTEKPIQGEMSDERFKVEMDFWLETNKLGKLNNDGTHKRNRFHHGFIAQEVRDLGINFGGFQDHSKNGGEDVLSIGYDEFIAPMIKAIQELKAEIELLKSTK